MKDKKYRDILMTIIRIMKYIYNISKWNFVINIFLTVLVGFTSGISLWATRLLINGILLDGTSNEGNFIRILIVYAVINILIELIQSINHYIDSKHQLNVDYGISMDIIRKAKELDLQDFENSEVYNILSKAEIEGRVKVYLTYRNILFIIIQITSMISIATIILSWNSYVFLLVFITPIISTIVNTKIGYRNYKMKMERVDKVRRTSYINFLLTNNIACKEIKTYNIGSYLVNIFSSIKKKIRSQDLDMVKLRSLWSMGLGFLEELVSLFVIFQVVDMAADGKILIGDTVAYIDSLSTIQSNVGGFLKSISEIYNDVLYVEEYFKLLDLEKNEYIDRQIKIDEIEEIEFRNVYFSYDNSNSFNLRNINIKICKGELIGIVGENGSGKTTFTKLLCGFYDNYQGEILVNGIELMRINPDSLRDRMGIIFQDFNQYEMTLRENIGFGNLEELNNDLKLLNILEEVNLKDKLKNYSNKIDTQMGKWFNGEELSKGQWQRVALGRAFVRDADVYILDEPTSSLDPISEKEIFDLMIKKSIGKIGIFITHRLDNIVEMNPRIIIFSEGTIAGDGKHEKLKGTCDAYSLLLID